MYSNKFVACIMVDDEVVREIRKDNSDLVYLPFGTDYQIRLKNLDHRRAVVSISIDGDDVLDGSRLVVEPNSTTDLKGCLNSDSNKALNAFRFIERILAIAEHRGDHVDDGLVRIEVQFEEDLPMIEQIIKWPLPSNARPWTPHNPGIWHDGGLIQYQGFYCQGQSFNYSSNAEIKSIECCMNVQPTMDAADVDEVDLSNLSNIGNTTNVVNDPGISGGGGLVGQAFTTTHVRKLSAEKTVIVFKILGKKSDSKLVVKPLLVKSKIECHTCGEKCKSAVKYCPQCGTCLL